jgi:integrase
MSEMVHLSHLDGDNFRLSVGEATIVVNELRIQDNSNWRFPHRACGKGGASIALDDHQLLQLMSEWLRYRISETSSLKIDNVDFKFDCWIRREATDHVAIPD